MLKKGRVVALISALALILLTGCDEVQKAMMPNNIVKQQTSKCALDAVNGERRAVVYASGGKVDFRGWAVDSNNNTVPELLNVVLTDKKGTSFTFVGAARSDRPDVVKVYRQDAFLKSGFRIVADVSTLSEGTYGISLKMPVDSSLTICNTKKVLVITK